MLKMVNIRTTELPVLYSVRSPPLGVSHNLTTNFSPFDSELYRKKGCASSTCEGVEAIQRLNVSDPHSQETLLGSV